MIALALLLIALVLIALALVLASALGVRATNRRCAPRGQFIEVQGHRLHYTDQGAGPAVVLIHGASSNLLEFEHSIAPLLARSHRVLCFDVRAAVTALGIVGTG